jgi:type I restriction enzyme M protein
MRCRSVSGSAITPSRLFGGQNISIHRHWVAEGAWARLSAPEVIAREIVEDLTAALVEFEAVAAAALEASSADS